MVYEYDELDYIIDLDGKVIKMDVYIWLVNLCIVEIQDNLMLCCGYSYLLGVLNLG